MNRSKSWLDVLRQLGRQGPGEPDDRVEAEARLWQSHEQAAAATKEVLDASARASGAAVRQRKLIDAMGEAGRNASGRADEIAPTLGRLSEALDRLRLVGLNVGLEAARLADPAGRALSTVADEVRSLVERGLEALQDAQGVVDEIRPSLSQVVARVEQLREADSELGVELGRAQNLAQEATTRINDLGEAARKLSETDPETARSLARAAEHARGLVAELTELRGEAQHRLARRLLRPVVEPLLRVLTDLSGGAPPAQGGTEGSESD